MAIAELAPHRLTEYLYELADYFNSFYVELKVRMFPVQTKNHSSELCFAEDEGGAAASSADGRTSVELVRLLQLRLSVVVRPCLTHLSAADWQHVLRCR